MGGFDDDLERNSTGSGNWEGGSETSTVFDNILIVNEFSDITIVDDEGSGGEMRLEMDIALRAFGFDFVDMDAASGATLILTDSATSRLRFDSVCGFRGWIGQHSRNSRGRLWKPPRQPHPRHHGVRDRSCTVRYRDLRPDQLRRDRNGLRRHHPRAVDIPDAPARHRSLLLPAKNPGTKNQELRTRNESSFSKTALLPELLRSIGGGAHRFDDGRTKPPRIEFRETCNGRATWTRYHVAQLGGMLVLREDHFRGSRDGFARRVREHPCVASHTGLPHPPWPR